MSLAMFQENFVYEHKIWILCHFHVSWNILLIFSRLFKIWKMFLAHGLYKKHGVAWDWSIGIVCWHLVYDVSYQEGGRTDVLTLLNFLYLLLSSSLILCQYVSSVKEFQLKRPRGENSWFVSNYITFIQCIFGNHVIKQIKYFIHALFYGKSLQAVSHGIWVSANIKS